MRWSYRVVGSALLLAAAVGTAATVPELPERDGLTAARLAFGAVALPDDHRAWQDKLTPALWQRLTPGAAGVRVIILLHEPVVGAAPVGGQLGAAELRARAIASVEQDFVARTSMFGLAPVRGLTELPIVIADLPADSAADVAGDPAVRSIEPDVVLHAHRKEGGPLISSPALRSAGGTGAGIGVAELDTGIDKTHPELVGQVTFQKDYTNTTNDGTVDDNGHGTAVAGILAGTGWGMAPQAHLWALKVLDKSGNGNLNLSLSAINDVLADLNGPDTGKIRVLNMSLGTSDANPTCDADWPSLTTAFESLVNKGVAVFCSAGNDSCTTGVSFPACISYAMAVGAVYDANGLFGRQYEKGSCTGSTGCTDYTPAADQIACFSNSGDDLAIWAPSDDCWTPKPGGGYYGTTVQDSFGGTSAASPYAAGVAAQLLSVLPATTVAQLRSAMTSTGKPITDTRNNVTRNRIDAMAAFAALGGGTRTYWLPVVVHAGGAGGSFFYSDVGLLNTGSTAADVELTYYPDSGGSSTTTAAVGAASQVILRDVVGQLGLTGKGMLAIASPQALLVTSRTYNKLAAGNTLGLSAGTTFGQYVDGYTVEDGLAAGQAGYLAGLTENGAYRTNVAVANAGSAPAQVTVTLYDGSGAVLAQFTESLSAGQLVQENQPFVSKAGQTNLAQAYARVSVVSGAGVLAYASVLDNTATAGQRPSDPTTIPLRASTSGATTTWLPVVAHAAGAGGSFFYSDLGMLNTTSNAASVTLTYYPDSGGSATATMTVGAGAQAIVRDVVGGLGQSGKGMMQVASSQPLFVTSRTYNKLSASNTLGLAAGTTFGQFIGASATDAGLSAEQTGYLAGLTENAAYRTNIAVANAGPTSAQVSVTLYSGTGAPLAQFTENLAPGQLVQENQPFVSKAGQTDLEQAYARVSVISGSAVLAYASVLDNTATAGQRPSDPTTIPLKR